MNSKTKKNLILVALNRLEVETIIGAINGEEYEDLSGIDAVREKIFEQAHDELLSDSFAPSSAFNDITATWSHQFREYFSAYLWGKASESERAEHNAFYGDLRRFAKSGGKMDYPKDTGAQATLDSFNSVDIEDAETEDEKKVLLFCIAEELEPPDDALERLGENIDAFFETLRFDENVDAAITATNYDSNLPVVDNVDYAPPEDWPDGMDPLRVQSRTCGDCGFHGKIAYLVDDGRMLVDSSGRTRDMAEIHEEPGASRFISSPVSDSRPRGQIVCDSCCTDQPPSRRVTIVGSSGAKCSIRVVGNMVEDLSYREHEENFDSLGNLTYDELIMAVETHRNSPSNFIAINTDNQHGPDPEQADIIHNVATGERRVFDEGPVLIYLAANSPVAGSEISVPNDDIENLKIAKDLLEVGNEEDSGTQSIAQ